MAKNALIVVDVQNDFCQGGNLAVEGANEIIEPINKLIKEFERNKEPVFYTKDWHPADHGSFAVNHGVEPFTNVKLGGLDQVAWPTHCVENTHGAELHKDLHIIEYPIFIKKGMDKTVDSYSAFYDNNKKNETDLKQILKGFGVEFVLICGLALDYCVYYTAKDAQELGFKTLVFYDASKPVGNPDNVIIDLVKRGIVISHSNFSPEIKEGDYIEQ